MHEYAKLLVLVFNRHLVKFNIHFKTREIKLEPKEEGDDPTNKWADNVLVVSSKMYAQIRILGGRA